VRIRSTVRYFCSRWWWGRCPWSSNNLANCNMGKSFEGS
jgi:hypothetical protein